MTDETKDRVGRWVETELGPMWFVPPRRVVPQKDEAKKGVYYHTDKGEFVFRSDPEDDIWRKDYEAARQFAWHNHALLSMCEKYEAMLSVCGVSLQVPEAKALEALSALRENLHTLTDLKIKKLPHNDVVFMSQPKPKKE